MNKHRNEKNKYKQLREHIKAIIDEWDPIGLLAMGAPEDEYDPEMSDIIAASQKATGVDELAIEISDIFVKWFGDCDTPPHNMCIEIAKKILAYTATE